MFPAAEYYQWGFLILTEHTNSEVKSKYLTTDCMHTFETSHTWQKGNIEVYDEIQRLQGIWRKVIN